ncbi:Ger(x)C family spore germination C-terminal domain-containing protein [Paenibacillus profundus]|uniref:Ger(X)C family spore germination C-terminal domain-containing protein n=2 Tax=Paenibacillus profundus TaxID=1173085 RepID=A0ABS8YRP1_9BACL|nr:Ger(x)C family spore germination C-terminal domain-containing protein [Paenibacillus profundus]
MDQFIRKLQRFNSDAVGFGEVYRSSVRHSNLNQEKWHALFPEAKIESRVQVNLVRTGTIE